MLGSHLSRQTNVGQGLEVLLDMSRICCKPRARSHNSPVCNAVRDSHEGCPTYRITNRVSAACSTTYEASEIA